MVKSPGGIDVCMVLGKLGVLCRSYNTYILHVKITENFEKALLLFFWGRANFTGSKYIGIKPLLLVARGSPDKDPPHRLS